VRAVAWTGGLAVALTLVAGAKLAEPHINSAPHTAASATHPLAVSVADLVSYPSNAIAPTPTPAAPHPAIVAPPKPKVSTPSRPASIVVKTTQQALINRDRAAYGLAPLTWSSCLYNVALSNARRMASQEYISHTNGVYSDLACGLGHQSGENVGYWSAGVNDVAINNLFMASPDHKANILGPYHYVATAWVIGANGYGYIAVEFA
jgi:uncharacterized protein YkwD